MRRAMVLLIALAACGGDDAPTVAFDLDGELVGITYWDLPFPSDLRLTADGTPDVAGYPNERGSPLVTDLLGLAAQRRGFPTMPVAYFRFLAPPPARSLADAVAIDDALLVDIDPDSPERGQTFAIVAKTLVVDEFAPDSLVAIAPRPGIVLRADTTYAVLLRRTFAPDFAPPDAFAQLADGDTPDGARGPAAAAVYAGLWPVLDELQLDRGDVLVATVFTTGDEIALLRARSEAVRADPANAAVIGTLTIDPDDGDAHDGFCELVGTVTFPQFQAGTPPFDTEGEFVLDGNGTPMKQGELTVPIVITLPAQRMPAAGWPLYQFFHGSGGVSSGVVNLGPTAVAGGMPEVGKGPAWVVARHGIAAVSAALPVNPERLVNAQDTEYLNINNLSAFPFTFEQGVIEQRLLLDALLALEIPPARVSACAGVSLPSGATAHRFDPAALVAGGQSMGGMYTNLVGAVDERFGALVPTGAGGFWNLMITETALIPGARETLAAVFGTESTELSFAHPGLAALALGWEIAEPMTAMARLQRRPLPGLPPRNVYEPIGYDDVYFSPSVFDAAALAYGNQQAGQEVWPGTQAALAADGLDGLATYPVANNRGSTTNVVVQYADDGIEDAHYIYRQLEAVKHQYGCFLATYLATGTAVVPAPGAIDDPCP